MATTWFPHGHHIVSMHTTWLPYGYYMVPCAHHVVSRWTPFGFQVDTMWFQGGQHRVSKVDTMWFLQDTTGFPHGCHVMSIWTPCVVEVTTWKPAQKTALHEANWLPCCTWHCTDDVVGIPVPRDQFRPAMILDQQAKFKKFKIPKCRCNYIIKIAPWSTPSTRRLCWKFRTVLQWGNMQWQNKWCELSGSCSRLVNLCKEIFLL